MSNAAALTALPAFLRARGVHVTVRDAAASNGRPLPFAPRAVIRHHTASNKRSAEASVSRLIYDGRAGIPGRLAQIFTARDGSVEVQTYGRANHAGRSIALRGIPTDSMNAYSIGQEVDNDGLGEEYPGHQLEVVRLVDAGLLLAMRRPASWLYGHKEIARPRGRKSDPKLDMDRERDVVAAVMAKLARRRVPVKPTNPPPKIAPGALVVDLSVLIAAVAHDRRGASKTTYGRGVGAVERALVAEGLLAESEVDGLYGPRTVAAYAAWQRKCGYGGDAADGVPGLATLVRLGARRGFRVKP